MERAVKLESIDQPCWRQYCHNSKLMLIVVSRQAYSKQSNADNCLLEQLLLLQHLPGGITFLGRLLQV